MRLNTLLTRIVRKGVRGTCLAVFSLMITGFLLSAPPLSAQSAGAPEAKNGEDPAQDILIEGLGFSKLVLVYEMEEGTTAHGEFTRLGSLLEKNLCWSGLFNLKGGRSLFCALKDTPQRIDMRLVLSRKNDSLKLRLYDTGPERLMLHEDTLSLQKATEEPQIIDLVNRLTERITGTPGILGSTIGFVLRQPGYAKVIVSTDTHNNELKLVSTNPDINILPRFSPKGNGLVYTVLGRRGSQVYFHSLLTGGNGLSKSRFLTPPGSLNTGGTFSPQGDRVVITMSVSNNADLFMVDLKDGEKKQLTSRPGIETQAHWSPDGSRLVFVSDRSGTPQIYLLDLQTGEDLRVTFDGVYNADPRWSPDGRSILFTKRVDGVDEIHIMDEYGENVRRITRSGRYTSEQAEWSPDGRQVIFSSNRTGEYKLYIVSADGSNLRRLTATPAGFEENSPTWTSRQFVR